MLPDLNAVYGRLAADRSRPVYQYFRGLEWNLEFARMDLLSAQCLQDCFHEDIIDQVDLPEPDTPVTRTNLPSGIFTLSLLQVMLFAAPLISTNLPFPFRLTAGSGTTLRPDR
jgi:hypothetical protein